MNVMSLNDSSLNSGHKLILLIILLNSADTVFTSLALDMGLKELNPLMATILEYGMTWFLFSKLIIVNSMILFVGLIGRNYYIGRMGMVLVSCAYSALIFYHVANLSHLLLIGKYS